MAVGSESRLGGGSGARIRSLVPSLPAADARVARFVLGSPDAILAMTVADLARASETSAATVVRACQRLGYGGFNDLKLALARETATERDPLTGELDPGEPAAGILAKVLATSAEAIRDVGETIETKSFEHAVDLVDGASEILVVGVGTSAPLAQDAAYRLTLLGLSADAPVDVHVQHVRARALPRGALCLAISHTGLTTETLRSVRAARGAGASTAGITSFAGSPFTEELDVALVASCREITRRLEAMASRIAHLSVLDALCAAVGLRRGRAAARSLERGYSAISEHRL